MRTTPLLIIRNLHLPDYSKRHPSHTAVRRVLAAFVMIAYLGTFSLPMAYADGVHSPLQAPSSRQEAPAPALTPEQIILFTDMAGEPENSVIDRLQADPKLAQLALDATGAYTKRKSSGKTKTIVGFTILGVGDLAAAIIMVTTPGYPDVKSGDRGQMYVGVAVGLVTLGVGLALGIPGIISLAKRSDEEWRAMEYYQKEAPAIKGPDQSRSESGKMITWPLLTYNF